MKKQRYWRPDRRSMVKATAVSAGVLLAPQLAQGAEICSATPTTEDGPLYPATDIPWSADMTRVPGKAGKAHGDVVYLYGQINSVNCEPVTDAVIELWQADNKGYYKHPRHTAPEALDPHFQYFAKAHTDAVGRYLIKTIVPKWYRIFDIDRAAHIHIKVHSPENGVITSEIYFSGADQEVLRENDPVFQSRYEKEKLIAERHTDIDSAGLSVSLAQGETICGFDMKYEL
ncbi:MAG: hypothetical protein ACR2PS_17860 [Pseudomonadales bacterium]